MRFLTYLITGVRRSRVWQAAIAIVAFFVSVMYLSRLRKKAAEADARLQHADEINEINDDVSLSVDVVKDAERAAIDSLEEHSDAINDLSDQERVDALNKEFT